MNRSPMPLGATSNVEMAQAVSQNPTFSSLAAQLHQEREMQAMKYNYIYTVSGSVAGGLTLPFNITIEQGSDFKAMWMTASAFSYNAGVATSFPMPNSNANTSWAARGLSIAITDTRSSRELTSGFIPIELIGTPGYGLNFQAPLPFKYLFYRNSKIRFDVRNRDNAGRTHYFEIALHGFKILSPN